MKETDKLPVCGIVMPISAIDSCSADHWSEVQAILLDAIADAGFEGSLVSNSDEVGVIQKRIIQNLYDNPIVVCDVSGKNPNVMFELGMRLAFDRPTIIVKDDKTSYSFDTSPIEHLEYPRDLRFAQIVEFKERLADKIRRTFEVSSNDPTYTTFLKHFGDFKVAKIDKTEVAPHEFIIEELRGLRSMVETLTSRSDLSSQAKELRQSSRAMQLDVCQGRTPIEDLNALVETLHLDPAVEYAAIKMRGSDHRHVVAYLRPDQATIEARARIRKLFPSRKRMQSGTKASVNAEADDQPCAP